MAISPSAVGAARAGLAPAALFGSLADPARLAIVRHQLLGAAEYVLISTGNAVALCPAYGHWR